MHYSPIRGFRSRLSRNLTYITLAASSGKCMLRIMCTYICSQRVCGSSHAGPFDCTITPRSEEVAQMIGNASWGIMKIVSSSESGHQLNRVVCTPATLDAFVFSIGVCNRHNRVSWQVVQYSPSGNMFQFEDRRIQCHPLILTCGFHRISPGCTQSCKLSRHSTCTYAYGAWNNSRNMDIL